MEIRSYCHLYLEKSSENLGLMLQYATEQFGIDGGSFLEMFIRCGMAEHYENGRPKYTVGKSAFEVFREVVEECTGEAVSADPIPLYDRTPSYWIGWMLAHYQWYSCHSYRSIMETVPYEELLRLYPTLHEADITKCYEVMDQHFALAPSPLQKRRKRCGLTQEELAERSGVSVNTIRAYERKSKDIGKAQFYILYALSKTLYCQPADLVY